MRRDAFSDIHPAVSFALFAAVLVLTAFVLHPAVTGISLVSACIYTIVLKGRRALLFDLLAVLPFIIVVAALNPLFNHEGATPLFYLWNGNAVTKEAVVYGLVSACMFAALIMWFYCMNAVMTSDKVIFLFGRVLPALSLIFSMTLRFVPRLVSRIREVSAAQKSTSPPMKKGVVSGVRHGISVISVTVGWALESSVVMSDSMRSRGYGGRGRTAYALYRFTARDALLAALAAAFTAAFVWAAVSKAVYFRSYPSVKCAPMSVGAVIGLAAFAGLCLMPALLTAWENVKWRILSSKL